MPRPQRSVDTRERVLEVAETRFAQKGYDGAHLESIATEVGVRKTALYYYFDSKELLYVAVLERMLLEFERTIAGVLDRDLPYVEKGDAPRGRDQPRRPTARRDPERSARSDLRQQRGGVRGEALAVAVFGELADTRDGVLGESHESVRIARFLVAGSRRRPLGQARDGGRIVARQVGLHAEPVGDQRVEAVLVVATARSGPQRSDRELVVAGAEQGVAGALVAGREIGRASCRERVSKQV